MTNEQVARRDLGVGVVLCSLLTAALGLAAWWIARLGEGGDPTGETLTDGIALTLGGGLGTTIGAALTAARSRGASPLATGMLAAVLGMVVPLATLLVAGPDDLGIGEDAMIAVVFAIPLLAAGWLGANVGRDRRRNRSAQDS